MKCSFYLLEGKQAAKALRERGGELSEEVQNELIKKKEEGETAESIVVRYCDWLTTTWNVDYHGDGSGWARPEQNPCAKDFAKYEAFDDEDYGQLANMVERHACDLRCA